MTYVRTYKYKCDQCFRHRSTRFPEIAERKVCEKCRAFVPVSEDQLTIFDAISDLNPKVKKMPDTEKEIDIVIWDLETNGFVAPESKILEIGAYIVRGDEVEHKRWVLDNKIDIDPKITAINGMTKEIIDAEGRDPKECLEEFMPLLRNAKVNVTHNGISFDIPFLMAYAKDIMQPSEDQHEGMLRTIRHAAFDTAVHYKAKKLNITQREGETFLAFASNVMKMRVAGVKYNLTLCAEEEGIDLTSVTAHRALGDVHVTYELYKIIKTV